MTRTIKDIIEGIIQREAGYVNNPKDLGGPTRWGITEKVARANGYRGDMRDLPKSFAYQILLDEHFIAPKFGDVAKLSMATAVTLADAGTLTGPSRPSTWLQVALNVLNREQTLYADVAMDGVIGSKTLKALEAYLEHRGQEGEVVLLRALNCQIGQHFITISLNREANEEFTYGWLLHRVNVL